MSSRVLKLNTKFVRIFQKRKRVTVLVHAIGSEDIRNV